MSRGCAHTAISSSKGWSTCVCPSVMPSTSSKFCPVSTPHCEESSVCEKAVLDPKRERERKRRRWRDHGPRRAYLAKDVLPLEVASAHDLSEYVKLRHSGLPPLSSLFVSLGRKLSLRRRLAPKERGTPSSPTLLSTSAFSMFRPAPRP